MVALVDSVVDTLVDTDVETDEDTLELAEEEALLLTLVLSSTTGLDNLQVCPWSCLERGISFGKKISSV